MCHSGQVYSTRLSPILKICFVLPWPSPLSMYLPPMLKNGSLLLYLGWQHLFIECLSRVLHKCSERKCEWMNVILFQWYWWTDTQRRCYWEAFSVRYEQRTEVVVLCGHSLSQVCPQQLLELISMTGASSTCKALCINASWSKFGGSKKYENSAKIYIEEKEGEIYKFCRIGGIDKFCGNSWNI